MEVNPSMDNVEKPSLTKRDESRKLVNKVDMGDRLRKVIEALGVRQRQVANRLNFSPGYVNDVLQGRTRPSLLFLAKLRIIYNVSPLHVMMGEGEMFLPPEIE